MIIGERNGKDRVKKENKQYTPEEILNALHVIQDTCEYYLHGNYEDCKKCPLCTMTGRAPSCTIRDSDPYVWEIDDNPDTTWRAFKK